MLSTEIINHQYGIRVFMAPFTLKKMSLLVLLLHQLKQGWYKNLREKKNHINFEKIFENEYENC